MKDDNLIIIASQPRSGSTLLQALLSNNEQVATVSEPWLLLPFLTYNKPEINNAKYSSWLASEGIKNFKNNINSNLFNDKLKAFLLSQYEQVLSNNEKFVLDKTPRYYEILDEIIELFPNAKVIVLKRNPFAILASIINTWHKDTTNKLLNNKRDILYAPFLLQTFVEKQKNNSNVFSISYEEIIENPEKKIKKIYNWIGINYKSNVLNYSNNKKFIGKMGDPIGIYQNKLPNSTQLEKWKETYHTKEWKTFFKGYAEFLTEDFLKKYGYGYNQVNSKKTKIFTHYKERADWSFNENAVPIIKILRNKIINKLNLLKY